MSFPNVRLVLAALVAMSLLVIAAPAQAREPLKRQKHTYAKLYKKIAKLHGKRAPGRNIIKYGIRKKNSKIRPANHRDVRKSIQQLRILEHPRVVVVPPKQPPGQVMSYGGGNYSIPEYIVQCESGGNYRALNPSGAGGAYQIMPGTWRAYGGTGSPHTAPPAEQDRIAAKIYAAQGAAPWVCG